jgi:putative ABC transport system substrate-binding protein
MIGGGILGGTPMPGMKRREFVALLGGAAATWPLGASAQGERMRRIGLLMPFAEGDQEGHKLVSVFITRLGEQGWTVGQNVSIDFRWPAVDAGLIAASAKDLVDQKCDLIIVRTSPLLAALMQQTRTIPILFFQVVDPIGQGFVANLARPDGNVTGFTSLEPSIGGKWVELLNRMAPRLTRVALMYNPQTARFAKEFLESITAVTSSVVNMHVREIADLESGIVSFAKERNGGLVVLPDAFTTLNRRLIVALTAQHQLPAIYPFRYFAAVGGLMSYGNDPAEGIRQAAVYADRILKGVRPADLPVQAPTKFELVINLKTAKALGLEVPPTLLSTADEVIE